MRGGYKGVVPVGTPYHPPPNKKGPKGVRGLFWGGPLGPLGPCLRRDPPNPFRVTLKPFRVTLKGLGPMPIGHR